MMSNRSMTAVLLSLAAATLTPPRSSAQTTSQPSAPLILPSMAGRDLFRFYCGSCHGFDGKGGGPLVPVLKAPPPDLTTMAIRNGGDFPRARVETLVTGDPVELPPAHGSKEMPVWGPIFQALDANDAMNRIRIQRIVEHVESLQQKR